MRKAWVIALAAVLVWTACGDDGTEDTATEGAPGAAGAQADQPTTTFSGVVSHDHGPGAAEPGCPSASTTLRIVASNAAFHTDCLTGTADQPLTLTYENQDQTGHNIVFLESHTATEVMFRADIFKGPATQTFTVPAQKAGTYAFHCEVHPARMKGTFLVK